MAIGVGRGHPSRHRRRGVGPAGHRRRDRRRDPRRRGRERPVRPRAARQRGGRLRRLPGRRARRLRPRPAGRDRHQGPSPSSGGSVRCEQEAAGCPRRLRAPDARRHGRARGPEPAAVPLGARPAPRQEQAGGRAPSPRGRARRLEMVRLVVPQGRPRRPRSWAPARRPRPPSSSCSPAWGCSRWPPSSSTSPPPTARPTRSRSRPWPSASQLAAGGAVHAVVIGDAAAAAAPRRLGRHRRPRRGAPGSRRHGARRPRPRPRATSPTGSASDVDRRSRHRGRQHDPGPGGRPLRPPFAANCGASTPGSPVTVTRLRWGGSLSEEAVIHADRAILTVAPHARGGRRGPVAPRP